jgi:hypothetical protein
MRKIRIGKDIKIRWGVTIDGEVADPAVYDLTLELRDAFGSVVEIAQPNLVDGLLETTFYGKDHKRTGGYRLTLWLNKGKEEQSVVDACDAFTLVSCSCDEGGDADLDLEVVDVATASLDVGGSSGGGSGVSDYALLSNKPRINDVVLDGHKTAEELGLQPKGDYALRNELPEVPDMNDYAKTEDVISALNALAEQIPTDYLTEEDLGDYAKKTDIPSVQGLASEDYVTQQIAATLGTINAELEEV